jgi:hypothetical protein
VSAIVISETRPGKVMGADVCDFSRAADADELRITDGRFTVRSAAACGIETIAVQASVHSAPGLRP